MQGGKGVREASYIFQELGDRFHWTAMLHCSLAVARMRMGDIKGAESSLREALTLDGSHADSLATMVSCLIHLGRHEEAEETLAKLRRLRPSHPAVLKADKMVDLFDDAVQSLTA